MIHGHLTVKDVITDIEKYTETTLKNQLEASGSSSKYDCDIKHFDCRGQMIKKSESENFKVIEYMSIGE